MIIHSRLNVLFDDPFWVGIFEREYEGRYEAARVVFGAEPKDYEVYEFFIKNYPRLVFSPSLDTAVEEERRINPKRMQRKIKKATEVRGIGTYALQALKLLQEQNKKERKVRSREEREAEAKRQFELRTQKKKEKRKGH